MSPSLLVKAVTQAAVTRSSPLQVWKGNSSAVAPPDLVYRIFKVAMARAAQMAETIQSRTTIFGSAIPRY